MSFIIVIPSSKRAKALTEKTLTMLQKYSFPAQRIHIFVDKSELEEYRQYTNGKGYHLHVGKKGLKNQRNFIAKFFPPDTQMICIDDDVTDLYQLDPKSGSLKPLVDFESIFQNLFDLMRKHHCHLGGIGPIKNAYFMKPTITFDLRFIVGAFWLCILPSKSLPITMDEKEDVERTIQYYIADGAVCRANYITLNTKYFQSTKNKTHVEGGMQSDNIDRRKAAEKSAQLLEKRYPELGYVEYKKGTNWPEFRLRRKPKKFPDIHIH